MTRPPLTTPQLRSARHWLDRAASGLISAATLELKILKILERK